jgi:KEOPS complex subunit Pcc1
VGETSRYPHDAVFVFEYSDDRRARLVRRTVGREVGEIDDERSRTTITSDDRTVRITVEARDLVALRAATNTWLGLVDTAERVIDYTRDRRRAPGRG